MKTSSITDNNRIYLYTGNSIDPLNPRAEDISIVDIAHGLSRTVRYNGSTEKPFTVGEHSIACALVAEFLGYDKRIQLISLFHDASECIVGDMNGVLKKLLPDYQEIESNISKVIWEMLDIEPPTEEEYEIVKKIDNCLLMNEINQLTNRNHSFEELDLFDVYVSVSENVDIDTIKGSFIELYEKIKSDK